MNDDVWPRRSQRRAISITSARLVRGAVAATRLSRHRHNSRCNDSRAEFNVARSKGLKVRTARSAITTQHERLQRQHGVYRNPAGGSTTSDVSGPFRFQESDAIYHTARMHSMLIDRSERHAHAEFHNYLHGWRPCGYRTVQLVRHHPRNAEWNLLRGNYFIHVSFFFNETIRVI